MTNLLPHWIGGAPSRATSDPTAPAVNPVPGSTTKGAPNASAVTVDDVIPAELPPQPDDSLAQRQLALFQFRELLSARKGERVETIPSGHGMVFPDAVSEVTRDQKAGELACGIPHRLNRGYCANAVTKVYPHSARRPLAVRIAKIRDHVNEIRTSDDRQLEHEVQVRAVAVTVSISAPKALPFLGAGRAAGRATHMRTAPKACACSLGAMSVRPTGTTTRSPL